jgi:hypothetical protein
VCHLATAGCWSRGVPERYVAGIDTRGRQEGRAYPWSQQVIHEISGLGKSLAGNGSTDLTFGLFQCTKKLRIGNLFFGGAQCRLCCSDLVVMLQAPTLMGVSVVRNQWSVASHFVRSMAHSAQRMGFLDCRFCAMLSAFFCNGRRRTDGKQRTADG